MTPLRSLVAAALCAVGITHAMAQNALQNGDFSAGLTGWNPFGDVTVIGPAQRAVLSTASASYDDDGLGVGFNNNSGENPVDFAFSPDLAGVPVSAIDIHPVDGPFVYEGSAIRQSFAATQGDLVTVSFDWAFLSLETTASDFAFVALNEAVVRFADPTSIPRASTFNGTFGDFGNVDWNWNTNSFSYHASASGTQSLAIGVVDVGDYQQSSELRLDNIAVQVMAIPEPETYALMLAGLAIVVGVARRRRT